MDRALYGHNGAIDRALREVERHRIALGEHDSLERECILARGQAPASQLPGPGSRHRPNQYDAICELVGQPRNNQSFHGSNYKNSRGAIDTGANARNQYFHEQRGNDQLDHPQHHQHGRVDMNNGHGTQDDQGWIANFDEVEEYRGVGMHRT
jgi:hypothetical protein